VNDALHTEALRTGRLRYCPVCDGYEVTDQNVALVGSGARAMREAGFQRSFTSKLTLCTNGKDNAFDDAQRAHLDSLGVRIVVTPIDRFELPAKSIAIVCDGEPRRLRGHGFMRLHRRSVIHPTNGTIAGPHRLGHDMTVWAKFPPWPVNRPARMHCRAISFCGSTPLRHCAMM
jgi:hypothetical protein